ncbi:MAG: hypothetical protein NC906_00260 [Candidatus Omnitrophica bacterium]|nr:hypothetical protein [Candidatus Omnitrophota bacterium]
MRKCIIMTAFLGYICSGHCQDIKIPPIPPQPIQQIQKNLENDVLVRMINELEITDEQMPEFISKFRGMANVIRKQREAKDKLIRDILPKIENEPLPKNLEEKIVEFDRVSQQTNETLMKIRDDIRKFLTPKQQIKLILMMDDIIERLLKQSFAPNQMQIQPLPVLPQFLR